MPAGRLRRLARNTAFSLLPLVVLLLLSELVLRVLGLGDPDDRLSLSRGFDSHAAYLLPSRDVPGGWRTNLSNGDWPETSIPPKGTRIRVVLFGGSNVQGFPGWYLEQALNEQDPEPGYEVVNLGRAGYGSERVRILVGQASELEPDIVLIYSGHNEFVEAGFAMELRRRWDSPLLMELGLRLSRLRTVNALASMMDSLAGDRTVVAPEPHVHGRDAMFRHINYSHTLVFYDVYEMNLRAMILAARSAGAEVLLSTVVGNMLDPPVSAIPDPDLPSEARRELGRLEREAAALMPARLVDGFVPQDDQDAVVRLRPSDWGNTLSGEALAERAAADVERHPPSLRLLSGPFAGGPLWPDPSFWLPEVERLVRTVAAFHERRLSPDERGDVRQAAERLEQAVRVAPDDPIALFRLAWCLYLLGEDDARAVRLFRDAARYDRAPTHGNDVTNGIVRKLAEEFPDVAIVDAEAAVCAHCPDGLVGYELMLDSCHVHAAARPMLLDEFVPTLLRLGDRVRARKLATPAR